MRAVLTIFLSALALVGSAQIDLFLSNYSLSEEGNHALISWTTSSGFTCEDITIEHGVDSNNLQPIYTYPGICGSEAKEEKYTYLFREIVYNQPNYFRINLGKFGISPLLEIQLVNLDGLNPKVYPNPGGSDAVLLFSNDDRNTASISVFNANGTSVGPSVDTRSNQVILSELNLSEPGMYFYAVEIKGVITRGKFIYL